MGNYYISDKNWHEIWSRRDDQPVVRVIPHGAGSFMGRDEVASSLAISVERFLNEMDRISHDQEDS